MIWEVMDAALGFADTAGKGKDREISPGGTVMRKSVFVQWLAALLLFSVVALWASGSIESAIAMDKGTNTLGGDPPVVDTIKQIEQDMGSAMVAGDVDKLSQIYGDDFVAVRILRQGHHQGDSSNRFQVLPP